MTTKRESILAAIKTALTGTTGVGTRIYRSRVEAFARSECPALVVEPLNDEASIDTSLPTLTWRLAVRVAVIVRGNIPDQIADPIVQNLHSRISADLTLGGIAMDIQPVSVGFDLVESDQPTGVVTCDYRVLYRTTVSDLSA
jgi:hypothetical protein